MRDETADARGGRPAAVRPARRADRLGRPTGRRPRRTPAPCARSPSPPDVAVLGPAEAPLALVRGRHRFRLLVKTARDIDLQAYLRAWLARAPKASGNTRVAIDVDPQSFL